MFRLFLTIAVTFVSCGEKVKPSVLGGIDSKSLPQQESWNSEIVLSDSGYVRAIIHAGYFRVFESSQLTLLDDGMTVQFYEHDGTKGSYLTSDSGSVNERTNDLEAHGNVVVTSPANSRLFTEHLYWDDRRQLIHTMAFVRIVSPKERLQGLGLESDQHLRSYRIFRVTGESKTQ